MQKVTINPSIAGLVDIISIGFTEIVPIYFTAEVNWVGTYTFQLWTSNNKETEISVVGNPLTTLNTLMTLTLAPEQQGIPVGIYYYEIFLENTSRVFFKGSLKIIE
jgi:hypothetical protein